MKECNNLSFSLIVFSSDLAITFGSKSPFLLYVPKASAEMPALYFLLTFFVTGA